MKIYILTENHAWGNFKAEHGLSYYIEHDSNVLFDTGHSDLFLQNAKKLNIDLEAVKNIVLSHGHWDHGNGLKYLKNKNLFCHPNVFQKRILKQKNRNIGLDLNLKEVKKQFTIHAHIEPNFISPKIVFLGEIPRTNSFEAKTSPFILEDGTMDFVQDDSGLAIINNDELIIISGCAHAGICNIVEHAKNVTGIVKIKAVLGGFHLKSNNKQTQETIEYLVKNKVEQIFPSHCTELPALAAFYEHYKFKQLKSGMILNF